jgi:hypothetical protein
MVQLLVNRQTPVEPGQHFMSGGSKGHKLLWTVPPCAVQLLVEMQTPVPVARPPPVQGPFTAAWVDTIDTTRTRKEKSFMRGW